MEMKYVVVEYDLPEGRNEYMFVFPKNINHDRLRESLEAIRHGGDRRWERHYPAPISAGFTDGKTCWGRSETLNLNSRACDTQLLNEGGFRLITTKEKS